MPSPVGHALAGLTVHAVTARDRDELRTRSRIALGVVAALAADLDLLLRFVDGRNHHQQASHSVGFALIVAAAAFAIAMAGGAPRPGMWAALVGAAWSSHVLLDYLSRDTSPPVGLMALWPFSDSYYKSPVTPFLDIGRRLDWATLRHDGLAAIWEACVLTPPLALAWRQRNR